MEEKNEKKSWALAKERCMPLVADKLTSMGYMVKADELPRVMITKNLTRYKTLLLNNYEFKGNNIFVLFNEDYSDYIDVEGNVCTEPQLYVIPKIENYSDIYENINLHNYGPYAVPINDFKALPAKEGFAAHSKKSIKKTETSEVNFDGSVDVENWDENFSALTIKDFIAILHCHPVSDKPQINEIIKSINVSRNKN